MDISSYSRENRELSSLGSSQDSWARGTFLAAEPPREASAKPKPRSNYLNCVHSFHASAAKTALSR